MVAALVAHRGRGGRDDDEIEVVEHQDVLTAVAPREAALAAGEVTHPPSVAVGLIGIEPGAAKSLARGADPGLRHDLASVLPAAVQIELAYLQHLRRGEQHLVAAEVDALRIARPA